MSPPIRRALARGAVCLLAATGAGFASAAAADAHAGDDGRIPGRADVARIDGEVHRYVERRSGYKIEQADRPPLYYHVDPIGRRAGAAYPLPTHEDAPICAASGHRIIAVWHHEPGADPAAIGQIRTLVRQMNWKIAAQAGLSSGSKRRLEMRVQCDAGQIAVREVISTANDANTIRNEVQTTYGQPSGAGSVKYLIFRDAPVGPDRAAGIGYSYDHTVKSASDGSDGNYNRRFTTSAMIWKPYWTTHTTIHELVHALGGSQIGAPNATAGGHCYDGHDLLCYNDQDGRGIEDPPYTESACPSNGWNETPAGVPLDCNWDTYFDALAEPGEWLATNWNLGGTENPFLVDPARPSFNGDNLADLVIADPVTGTYRVALNGTGALGAFNSGSWQSSWGGRPPWAGVGDFNGDNAADTIVAFPGQTSYAVSVSTGSALEGPGTSFWLTGWSAQPNWGGVGDFNGDGLDDLVIADAPNDAYAVALSDGTRLGAGASGIWLSGYGSRPDWAGVGDFNGDGKDDLMIVEAASLSYRVMLSTGSSFGAAGSGVWQRGWGRPDWGGVGDFDGDGKDDFIGSDGTNHTYAVSISTGSALAGPGTQLWLTGWDGRPNVADVGDFNGDAKDDLIISDDSSSQYGVALSDGARLNGSIWLTGWNSAPHWGATSR